mmetsp:Transcript_42877/g.84063  ORF Transcript_42877/g.84063 Transcript_42877/m.84063 type:complete len:208 (-) Transcript_42877:104-727(-)
MTIEALEARQATELFPTRFDTLDSPKAPRDFWEQRLAFLGNFFGELLEVLSCIFGGALDSASCSFGCLFGLFHSPSQKLLGLFGGFLDNFLGAANYLFSLLGDLLCQLFGAAPSFLCKPPKNTPFEFGEFVPRSHFLYEAAKSTLLDNGQFTVWRVYMVFDGYKINCFFREVLSIPLLQRVPGLGFRDRGGSNFVSQLGERPQRPLR